MTEIQPFTFPATGQQIRAILIDGEPWFVARDALAVLGLTNITEALRSLDEDEFTTTEVVDATGRQQQMYLVSESGLYSLILRSRKVEAKAFKRWLTHDVLPTIRKTGRFELVPQHEIPRSFAEALELAAAQARTIEDQRAQLDWAEPRAAYVDQFVDGAKDATTIRDLAKQLAAPERKLYAWLVERGLIYRVAAGGGQEYRPRAQIGTRKSWFVLRDQPDAPRYHNGQLRKTLYVTPAGKVGIAGLLDRYPILGQTEIAVESETA